MLGFEYLKTNPTQFVMHYSGGRLARSGAGLAFFYYRPTSNIVVVPTGSVDVPFIFNDFSADYQPVSIQGQLIYRISDPQRIAGLLDFSIDGAPDHYKTEDPLKLPARVLQPVQVAARAELLARPLRQALTAGDEIAAALRQRTAESEALAQLGVTLLDLNILAVRPNPETGRALEADAREALLRQADEAIYSRRNAAIEQERRIKENELNTELAVQAKQRQIREAKANADLSVEGLQQQIAQTKLQGDVTLEERRKELVSLRSENVRQEADAQAYTVRATLEPLAALDRELVQMLALQTADPRRMVGLALRELAANASKIGRLNISPDLLDTLLQNEE